MLSNRKQCQPLETTQTLSPISGQMSVQSSPPPYSTIPGTVPLYNSARTAGPPPSYEDVINPEGIEQLIIPNNNKITNRLCL